jgi:pyruvate kinase
MSSRAQIVATIGPSSKTKEMLCAMSNAGMDVARLNFAWIPDEADAKNQIRAARDGAAACGHDAPIILADLPARRIAEKVGHTYDPAAPLLTPEEEAQVAVCIEEKVEYFALSFVGGPEDVDALREVIKKYGGNQKIIAKIERKMAVDNLDAIIAAADGVMVARGDLGSEVPLEDIPFVQKTIVTAANAAGKSVIVATQMMLSMTEHTEPTRAEVTDVEAAIMDGADAVMLSEESASGHFPVEAVAMMERIVVEAEKHRGTSPFHLL